MALQPPEVANIDFDIFLYQYGFGYQKTIYTVKWGPHILEEFPTKDKALVFKKEMDEEGEESEIDSYVVPTPFHIVRGALNAEIAEIMSLTKTTSYQGFLTGPGNYRNQLATINTYKKSRKNVKKPFHYQALKQFLIEEHSAIVVQGIEADDALGIAQDPEGATIICSKDKDLKIVPGWHFNLTTQEITEVSEFGHLNLIKTTASKKIEGGGKMFHAAQMLMGDSCDDIPGIPGHGPVKTYNILKDCKTENELYKEVELRYQDVYGKHYLPLMVQVGRLLWMQQTVGDVWLPPGIEEL